MNARRLFAVAAAFCLVTSVAFAQEEGEFPLEMQETMQKWEAYMTPGEPHAEFAKMAGDWEYTSKMWYQPGMPPQETTGTAEFETILGGRYLVQHVEGPMMGMPFLGMGLTGYDNMKKKYQSIWIDNMGTGVMVSEGTCEGDVCTYYGDAPDLMLGKYKRVKSVARKVNDDEMVFEMYDTGPDGKEWKNFELTYRRKK